MKEGYRLKYIKTELSKYRIRSRKDKKNYISKFREQHQQTLWQSDGEKGRQTDRPSDRPDRPDRRAGGQANTQTRPTRQTDR